MKKIYALKYFNEDGKTELNVQFYTDELYTSLKGACRRGERMYRKFGWKYRIITCYAQPDFKFVF